MLSLEKSELAINAYCLRQRLCCCGSLCCVFLTYLGIGFAILHLAKDVRAGPEDINDDFYVRF